ncbi:estradiol 17 beta-dehydrogenase, putative [Ricinus communis]|uniref:Estradiol 17 beta-dehydrogenase, putative n=1 Tax=Ricinus communis TaxID=3988 RepID=B9T9F0_RICCO|nr:estradiol 17 beta-dehydrogenase, putative [Ricinus communis]
MTAIDFTNRVAIITGAGGGLGRAYALDLAGRGAAVVVNDIGKEAADKVVQEIVAAGGKAIANYESVGTRAGADANVATAMDNYGRVDIVINNAGNQANGRFENMSDADYESVLAVHLKGAFALSQSAYKVMMKQQYGRFLFTSSSSGIFGHFIRANYASAKAGLIGLMHAVYLEGARYNITANALLPVAAPTASKLGKVPENTLWPDWEARMPERQPEVAHLADAMTPAHVAGLVTYLVSEACTASGGMYSAVGSRFSRVFIGATQGWMKAGAAPASAEEIEAHFAQIQDRAGFEEYPSLAHEMLAVSRRRAELKG